VPLIIPQKKLGIIAKDPSSGPFVDEWKKVYEAQCKDVEQVDISTALSTHALAIKDEVELRAMRTASKACVAVMTPLFLDQITAILDEEKKVKHSVLADKIDRILDDNKWWKNVSLPGGGKLPGDLDPKLLDWTIGPLIQSGGKYDLRMQTGVNNDFLHTGIIIAAMGLRYKQYSSLIARTYLVSPNKSQESNYKLVFSLHKIILSEIRDGVATKDVYNKALAVIREKKPDLEKHFLKNVGYGIGLETKDHTLMISGKNSRILKDGMTLVVSTGFADIENPQAADKAERLYSLVTTDTVRVTTSEPVVFTGESPTQSDAVSFFYKDEAAAGASSSAPAPAPKREKKDPRVGAVATKNITQTRLRSERTTQVDDDAEKRRRAHQKELATKKQDEGLERYADATGSGNGVEVKKFKKFESYKRENQMPAKTQDLEVVVDAKANTVIIPILGRPVAYHINTIKNASTSDENDWSYLRINFLSPGQGVGRKDEQPFEDASAHFLRSLSLRSTNGARYAEIATQIANMKRDTTKKEQEKKDLEDVVEQDKLQEIRSGSRACFSFFLFFLSGRHL
jgi:nucleosome binding factor SPN SPT16 subunit